MKDKVHSEVQIQSHPDHLLEKTGQSGSAKPRIKGVHRFKTFEAFNEWKAYEAATQSPLTGSSSSGRNHVPPQIP
jgi:hypothetical protein